MYLSLLSSFLRFDSIGLSLIGWVDSSFHLINPLNTMSYSTGYIDPNAAKPHFIPTATSSPPHVVFIPPKYANIGKNVSGTIAIE